MATAGNCAERPLGLLIDPKLCGYLAVYRPGELNRCPGCGRCQWLVGRLLSECAFCATALPIVGKSIFNMEGES